MAAVLKLTDDQVEGLCARARRRVAGQLQLPRAGGDLGPRRRPRRRRRGGGELGGKLIRLKVSGAFHSPLMADAAERLAPALECGRVRRAQTRFMSTVSNQLETAEHVPGLLLEQLTAPVRFTQAVQALIADGVDTFVEIGPGGVLAGLIKRIDRGVAALSIGTPR